MLQQVAEYPENCHSHLLPSHDILLKILEINIFENNSDSEIFRLSRDALTDILGTPFGVWF